MDVIWLFSFKHTDIGFSISVKIKPNNSAKRDIQSQQAYKVTSLYFQMITNNGNQNCMQGGYSQGNKSVSGHFLWEVDIV